VIRFWALTRSAGLGGEQVAGRLGGRAAVVKVHPRERRMEGQPAGLQRPAVAGKPLAGSEDGLTIAEEADAAVARGQ
jgi:hypothetical protein